MKKKIFSLKLLSVILCLCLIFTLFSAIPVLAEEVEAEPTTEVVDNSSIVYKYDFVNVTKSGINLTNNDAVCTGKEVVVKFKYHLIYKNSQTLYIARSGSNDKCVDATTNDRYLLAGTHQFSYTATATDRNLALTIRNENTINATLYIWDVTITVAGTNYFKPFHGNTWNSAPKTYDNGVVATYMTYAEYQKEINTPTVYKITYDNAPGYKAYTISKAKVGQEIDISFDYKLTYVTNNTKPNTPNEAIAVGCGAGGWFNDNTTGTSYLLEGEHSYRHTATYESKNSSVILSTGQFARYVSATLYIWNVSVKLDGVEMFDVNAQQICAHKNVTMTEGTYDDMINDKPAYLIDFNNVTKYLGYTLAPAKKCTEFSISFKYKVENAAEKELWVGCGSGGSFTDNTTGSPYLNPGVHEFYHTSSYDTSIVRCPAIYTAQQLSGVSNAKIYIWDVSITHDGVETFDPTYNTQQHKKLNGINLSKTTYGKIQSTQISSAYLLDFEGSNQIYFLTNHWQNYYNKPVEITFDYYLANAKDFEVSIYSRTGSYVPNQITNDTRLLAGKHSYRYVVDSYTANNTGTIALGVKTTNTNAKLYIWNVSMYGTSQGGSVQNLFTTRTINADTATDIYPKLSEVNNIDLGKGDANNDGKVNVFDLIRVKRHILSGYPINKTNANINLDYNIGAQDLVSIKKLILGEVQNREKKIVVCWGDSITEGMGMQYGTDYPTRLQELLGDNYKVINAGVSGETSTAIMSRANAIPICLTNDITFPAGKSYITLSRDLFSTTDGEVIYYRAWGNKLPFKTVIIGGVEYDMLGWGKNAGTTFNLYRKGDTSSALTIPAGTSASFDYSEYFDEIYCNVMLVGANDGGPSVDTLITKYTQLAATAQNSLMIIPHYDTDYSAEFKAAFGTKALDIRSYFMTDAAADYGFTLNSNDNSLIAQGHVPNLFNYNLEAKNCHLNELGYQALANQLYKQGKLNNYW